MRKVIEATCRECGQPYLVTARAEASVRLCPLCIDVRRWTLAGDDGPGSDDDWDQVWTVDDPPVPGGPAAGPPVGPAKEVA